jgi:energy-converting hydrogenase Eha subunit G
MAKKASINSIIFGGVLSGFAAIAVVGLLCITLFVKYNKPGTKLFKDIQPMQYVGIALCILGAAPFIQYFFMGFLFSAGESVFSSMFE